MRDGNETVAHVSYLVGGLRISLGDDSTTPGPRTHILGFTHALRRLEVRVDLHVASSFPGMRRFTRVKQADYRGMSRRRVLLVDLARLGCGLWCGVHTFLRGLRNSRGADVIYERTAVFQSMSSFHPAKRRAIRVVEANGVLSRETAHDRKVLVLERLAAAIERRVLRRADLIVAVSDALKSELAAFANVDPDRILVLPNAADRAAVTLPVEHHSDEIVVGFVGSVVAWHRLDKLLQGISRVREQIHPTKIRVEIVGDGPVLGELRELSEELGLAEDVTFLGRVPHARALERMKSWSIGFAGHEKSSSHVMYHSPLKLYEYAALGLHILCSQSADAASLQDSGAAIFTYDADDDEALMHQLREAVHAASNDRAPERRLRRERMRREHTWEARGERFLAHVSGIGKAGGGPHA